MRGIMLAISGYLLVLAFQLLIMSPAVGGKKKYNKHHDGSVNRTSAIEHAPFGSFNNFSEDVFGDTFLGTYVNFRFREHGDPVNFPPGSVAYRRQHHEPLIFKRFDWVIWHFDAGHVQGNLSAPPRSVLLRPTEVEAAARLLPLIPTLKTGTRRLLVIAGEDVHLSKFLSWFDKAVWNHYFLFTHFSDIFYEAKDVQHDRIKTVPMGFTNFYALQLGEGFIELQIEQARKRTHKEHLVFAGWGKVWSKLDQKVLDRAQLGSFLELNTTQQWVHRQSLSFEEYWSTLSAYKFALCPLGNGIQAPKLFEALVLRVVPVVTRVAAFEDLRSYGFPVLIVDRWEQLSTEYLQQQYEAQFEGVDWDRVERMITIEGVWSLLMDGNRYPE